MKIRRRSSNGFFFEAEQHAHFLSVVPEEISKLPNRKI
jgi:hypothetical protein